MALYAVRILLEGLPPTIGGTETMAMPQRDDTIEAIKRVEPPSRVRYGGPGALLENAVMHSDEEEAARIREYCAYPFTTLHRGPTRRKAMV